MIFANQIQEKFSEFSKETSKTRNEIQDKVAIEEEKINSAQKLLDEKILLEKTEFLMKENLPAIDTSHKCGTKWQQIATFDRKEKDSQKFEAVKSQINTTKNSRNTFNEKMNLLISSKNKFDKNIAENSLESYVKKGHLGNKMNEIDSRLEKGVNKEWEDLKSELDDLNDALAEKMYREDVKTRHEAVLITFAGNSAKADEQLVNISRNIVEGHIKMPGITENISLTCGFTIEGMVIIMLRSIPTTSALLVIV